jgi:hypothetical protein
MCVWGRYAAVSAVALLPSIHISLDILLQAPRRGRRLLRCILYYVHIPYKFTRIVRGNNYSTSHDDPISATPHVCSIEQDVCTLYMHLDSSCGGSWNPDGRMSPHISRIPTWVVLQ